MEGLMEIMVIESLSPTPCQMESIQINFCHYYLHCFLPILTWSLEVYTAFKDGWVLSVSHHSSSTFHDRTDTGWPFLSAILFSKLDSVQQLFMKPHLLPWAVCYVYTGEYGTVPALGRHSSELGNGMHKNKMST